MVQNLTLWLYLALCTAEHYVNIWIVIYFWPEMNVCQPLSLLSGYDGGASGHYDMVQEVTAPYCPVLHPTMPGAGSQSNPCGTGAAASE